MGSGAWIPIGILAVAVLPFANIPAKRRPEDPPRRVKPRVILVLAAVLVAWWLISHV